MLASELVAQVRRAAQLPTVTTDQLSDADILAHADMEIQSVLLPEVRQVQQDYLTTVVEVASDATGFVALPRRAATGAVRLVQLLQSGVATPLPRMDPAEDPGRAAGGSGLPAGFYFDGGGLRLVPAVSSGTLRIHYYVTPPKLVLETTSTRVARITITGTFGDDYEVETDGASITATDSFDFIGAGGTLNDVYGEAVPITGVPEAFTVPISALRHAPRTDDFVVGYSAVASSRLVPLSPVVPLPEEMSPVVVARTAARALESLGYLQEAGAKWASAEKALQSARRLLTPRSDGNPRVLTGGLNRAIRGPWWPGDGWRGW